MRSHPLHLILPTLTLVSVASLHAASLIHYDFNQEQMAPTAEVPGVFTGGELQPKVGTGIQRFSHHNWKVDPLTDDLAAGEFAAYFRSTSDTVTAASALGNDAFFSITVRTESTLSLDLIELNLGVTATDGPYGLFLRSSLTGTTNLFDTSVTNSVSTAVRHETIDLTQWSEFSDVEGEVTFRFYLYGTQGATNRNLVVDDITFSAVPELSAALLAVGSIPLVLVRRRR